MRNKAIKRRSIRKRKRIVSVCVCKCMCICMCLCLLLSVCVCLGASPAFADDSTPVTVELPVKYVAAAQDQKSDYATFLLAAKEKENPMPEGAREGVKIIKVRAGEEASFGPIRYDRPDVYDYTVSRADEGREEAGGMAAADAAVYDVRIIAANDGESSVIIHKRGEAGKSELVYVDEGSEEEGGRKVQESGGQADSELTPANEKPEAAAVQGVFEVPTGDEGKPVLLGMCALSSAAVFLYLLAGRRRTKQDR